MNREAILDVLREAHTVFLGECPVCSTDAWQYFGGRFHFDLRVEYWICPECTLVGQSPMLNELVLQQFYREFYRELYQGNPVPTEEDCAFERKRGRNILEIFTGATSIIQIGDLLDIGSSTGGLLSVGKCEFNANVVGLELNKEYSDYARGNGLPIFDSFEALKAAEGGVFDLVTASHVLEHIADLHTFLEEVSGLVKTGGYVCLEVPHASEGACFEILHLWGFNEASLTTLLRRYGFETVYTTTHGYPRSSENTNLYLVVVARKTNGEVSSNQVISTARQARKQRYMLRNENPSNFAYQQVMFKNTIKQLLGLNKGKPVAYSYFPTKLKKYRLSAGVG